ncbi:MAG: pilin, partial [Candidatus Nealsonbacteria bacterium]
PGDSFVPQLYLPKNNATNVSLTPTFSWYPVEGANYYEFIVLGAKMIKIKTEETELNFDLIADDDGFTIYKLIASDSPYSWQVRASQDGGVTWGARSEERKFTTKKSASTSTPTPTPSPTPGGGGSIFSCPECESEASSDCPANQICNPLKFKSIECLICAIITFLIKLAIPVATVMFVIAGIMFVTAAGDPERFKKAKRVMIYTAVGFSIILVARGLISVLQSLLGG